jgi:hypothetical protein
MKETIAIISLIIGGLMLAALLTYALAGFGIWVRSDPFDWIPDKEIMQEFSIYKYSYKKCYDNDNNNFSQEYVDTKTEEVFKEATEKYGACRWEFNGRQDIIGCTGDLYYSFNCK